mmetsp:Transcript_13601/g.46001  ORF Transcript_13601/g.46001 Transcript_13601/m.46001 type:complete len:283 (+) Transcript_13601:187-1035(+)
MHAVTALLAFALWLLAAPSTAALGSGARPSASPKAAQDAVNAVLEHSPTPSCSEWCAYLTVGHVRAMQEHPLEAVAALPADSTLPEVLALLEFDHGEVLTAFRDHIAPVHVAGGDMAVANLLGGPANAARMYTQLINSCIAAGRWRLARNALSQCGAVTSPDLYYGDSNDRQALVDVTGLTLHAVRLSSFDPELSTAATVERVTDLSLALVRLALREASARAGLGAVAVHQGGGVDRHLRAAGLHTGPDKWLHMSKTDAKGLVGVVGVAATKEPRLMVRILA